MHSSVNKNKKNAHSVESGTSEKVLQQDKQ